MQYSQTDLIVKSSEMSSRFDLSWIKNFLVDFSCEGRFWQGLFHGFYAEKTGLACVISWAVGLFWVQVWTDRPFWGV